MNRLELIKTLGLVSHALERNNVIPMYEYFCFTGDTVFAFNDVFGIVAPCKVKQPFATMGPTFLKLLNASKSEEVRLDLKNNQLLITADHESNFPCKGVDEFVWEEPKLKAEGYGTDVTKGIAYCLATSGDNLALEAYMRICIGSSNNKINIYSTDGDALTRYATDTNGTINTCLSRAFCNAISKIGKPNKLIIDEEWTCAILNDCKIYGRNLGPSTFDYEGNITKILGGESLNLVPYPDELNNALTRARVVAEIETSPTSLFIENNELVLATETPFGEIFDSMKIKHSNINIKINAALLQTNMADCTAIKVLKNCCVLQGENILRLVSNMG